MFRRKNQQPASHSRAGRKTVHAAFLAAAGLSIGAIAHADEHPANYSGGGYNSASRSSSFTDTVLRTSQPSPSGLNYAAGPFRASLNPSLPDQTGSEWGQNATLGFELSDFSMRMKWDNKYKTRGGFTLGAVLDEEKHYAIGAGFLTNHRAQEGYGQFQFVVPELDPWSSFTLGEHVSQATEYYLLDDRQVRTYTTYLNWFKRNPGRQGVSESLPPSLAAPLQTLMDNVSSLSGTATYGFSPMERSGFQGSPRTNASDLSLRAVTPSILGAYLPVSVGTGVNIAHYNHVDNTTQWKAVGNGGLGVAFLGGDYFGHSLRWLVGMGGDVDTRGVVGGTAAAEVGPLSLSYRQTSHKEQTLLASWRVSDLWTEDQKQRASTLSVANGNGPLNLASQPMPSSEDSMRETEGALGRLGFLPPTGAETAKPTSPAAAKAGMRLSAAGVAEQPRAIQESLKRSQELAKEVRDSKNSELAKSCGKAICAPSAKVSGTQATNAQATVVFTLDTSEYFSGENLTYSNSSAIANLSFDSTTGRFSGTIPLGQVGDTYNRTITATNSQGSASVSISITVVP
ncbi:MAG: putative Ig domain-containing protein [Alphaproteobacteria bacterium]|nr:putative Ig domain-containing protein [Alphaproteobacteria bacterium]